MRGVAHICSVVEAEIVAIKVDRSEVIAASFSLIDIRPDNGSPSLHDVRYRAVLVEEAQSQFVACPNVGDSAVVSHGVVVPGIESHASSETGGEAPLKANTSSCGTVEDCVAR